MDIIYNKNSKPRNNFKIINNLVLESGLIQIELSVESPTEKN